MYMLSGKTLVGLRQEFRSVQRRAEAHTVIVLDYRRGKLERSNGSSQALDSKADSI